MWRIRQRLVLSRRWCIQAWAWGLFLALGLISTVLSPFPGRSFFGHSITANGWLYWLLLTGFTLSNSLILQRFPQLFYWQLRGMLIGSAIVALSIYPQLLNWKIDYTMHSGQLWPESRHVLMTAIYQDHQPIGLYSHRGYAGFTLAMSAVLSVIALLSRWLSVRTSLVLTCLYALTLSFVRVRGAVLAMLVGWAWLMLTSPSHRVLKRLMIVLALVGVLSFTWVTTERRVVDAEIYASTPFHIWLKHFTSDRIYLWQRAWKGIAERPLIGWGFSGYSIRDAIYSCPEDSKTVALYDYKILCQQKKRKFLVKAEPTKAHNLPLDLLLSTGLPGLFAYLVLLVNYMDNSRDPKSFYIPLALTYIVYVMTWYDTAQFSHLIWWLLSSQRNQSMM